MQLANSYPLNLIFRPLAHWNGTEEGRRDEEEMLSYLPDLFLHHSNRWPDLEVRNNYLKSWDGLVPLPRERKKVSLTNQLECQDTMWHCPLDVIMLCGCEVIPSHKVRLKETIVWVIQPNFSSWFSSVSTFPPTVATSKHKTEERAPFYKPMQ